MLQKIVKLICLKAKKIFNVVSRFAKKFSEYFINIPIWNVASHGCKHSDSLKQGVF